MNIVLLLLIIPVFSVGLVLYITNIYYFLVTGDFDELMFIISMVLSIPTSYFIPQIFINLIKSKSINFLNNKNKYLIISNYFSIILLFILGISLLYRGILNLNNAQIIFGVGIILVFVYCTYTYFAYYEEQEFTLDFIYPGDNCKEFHFTNEECTLSYYVEINDNKYKENHRYIIKYNKYINSIKRINGMVLGGETHEKNNKEKHKKETGRV